MQLRELSIENLNIPFRVSFQHSSALRTKTESILVTAITEKGQQGQGEGCPREYVTGETLDTSHDFFNIYRSEFLNIHTLDDLKDWSEKHCSIIDENPAVFCAVELALLNVLAKEKNISVESLLSLPELTGKFYYSAVIGTPKLKTFQEQLQQYLKLELTDYKVKIFGDLDIDQKNIEVLSQCNKSDIRLRLDANNLWSSPEEAINYFNKLNHPIFALEEPLAKHQYNDCLKISESLNVKTILDESFLKIDDFKYILSIPNAWIINIRISKMGGVLRSLEIVNKARLNGIPIIIGAQVGETSILTRAAITLANTCRDILVAQEGAFGTYLLERDMVEPSIKFGMRGIVNASQL